ncbi:MAG: hypothetical protein V5A24_04985 [Haloarculaceae archaeon]
MTTESPPGEAPTGEPDDDREAGRDEPNQVGETVRVEPNEEGGTNQGESNEEAAVVRVEPDEGSVTYPTQAPTPEEFGWEGWLVVGVLILSFLVVPPAIVLLPEARGLVASLGLTMRDAYLALPMVPAILLGATAVWAAVRIRGR